jgi:hypothetical protein
MKFYAKLVRSEKKVDNQKNTVPIGSHSPNFPNASAKCVT